jgi:hypothetical protein
VRSSASFYLKWFFLFDLIIVSACPSFGAIESEIIAEQNLIVLHKAVIENSAIDNTIRDLIGSNPDLCTTIGKDSVILWHLAASYGRRDFLELIVDNYVKDNPERLKDLLSPIQQ